MRIRVLTGLLLSAVAATGCSAFPKPDECRDLAESSPRVMTVADLARVPVKDANTVLVVTNASDSPTRLRVRFGHALALDARLSGAEGCAHPPIYSYAFRLPTGRTDVTASTGDGTRKVAPLLVGDRKQWVTVMSQQGFPLYVRVTPTRPQFG